MKTLFEIRHRWLGTVLFSVEAESFKLAVELAVKSGADLRGADLSCADLRGADLRGADLRGADLRGAALSCADLRGAALRGAALSDGDLRGAALICAALRGADLRGAALIGAKYRDSEVTATPISITGLTWDVLIIAGYIRIGCQEHTVQAWSNFSDEEISVMDSRALKFWKANKVHILAMGGEA